MRRNYWLRLLRNVHKCSYYQNLKGDWVTKSHTLSRQIEYDGKRLRRCFLKEQDIAYQWKLQEGLCYWLKIPLDLDLLYTYHNPLTPSVDRIDSSKDYTADNIVISTRFANLGRGTTNFYESKKLFELIRGEKTMRKINFLENYVNKSF